MVLYEYQVSLAQVTRISLLHVIGFIWLCEFSRFPLTLKIFQACFDLRTVRNNATYWYAFYSTNGTNSQAPKEPNLYDRRIMYTLYH